MQEIKKDMYNFEWNDWIVSTCYLSQSHTTMGRRRREEEGGMLYNSYSPHTTAQVPAKPVHPSSHLSSRLHEGTEAENGKHLPSFPRAGSWVEPRRCDSKAHSIKPCYCASHIIYFLEEAWYISFLSRNIQQQALSIVLSSSAVIGKAYIIMNQTLQG